LLIKRWEVGRKMEGWRKEEPKGKEVKRWWLVVG